MNDLNIGIIGAGHIGSRQAQVWSRVDGGNVVAVADNDGAAAERVAKSLPGATPYGDAAALLAHPGLDIVHVCVPTHLHREIVIAAAQAGKQILCEKPMALSLEDCDAMGAAANAAGVLLSVGHVLRFFPEYAQAKQLVASGAIGNPAIARVRRAGPYPKTTWFLDSTRSGGVVADLSVHDIDWLLWCFGPAVRVFARIATTPGLEYALLTIRHASGVISHAESVWGEPSGFHATYDIAGDAGLLTHDSRKARSIVATPRGEGAIALPNAPLAAADDPYFRQVQAFAAAVRGSAPVAVTAADARAAIAVVVAALESARTGQAVELEATHA